MDLRLFAVLLAAVFNGYSAEVICITCHPTETALFGESAMGRSIGPPVGTVPAGSLTHSESGSAIQISWQNGQMVHRLTELGLRAAYPIRYQIGAGNVGHSYVTAIGEYLLQSPASYYRRYGWDVSPGFKDTALLDFDRVLGNGCLFCHSNNPEFVGRRKLANDAALEAIGCARCHGDTRQHVAHPSKTNIVNPARLARRARDSVCEQCHLEGIARVLNPGKTWRGFEPGEELEETLSVYVEDKLGPGATVVSQVEQLALSRCAIESGGKLWCGTCHDPHRAKTASRASQLKAICASCHSRLSPASHAGDVSDCVSCHMPRLNPNDVAHAASTNHHILARPETQEGNDAPGSIRAWHDPAPALRLRNLGLAELHASATPRFQFLGEAGERSLEQLPSDQQENDPAVLVALGDLSLSRGRADQAEDLFRKALRIAPWDGDCAMYLGIALKEKGDLTGAADALRKAIAIDPSLQRAYLELSALHAKQGDPAAAAGVLKKYLNWNPQSILVRSALQVVQ